MSYLTELLGHDDQEWMSHPGRPCAIPTDAPPIDARNHADQWFPTPGANQWSVAKLCHGCPVITQCRTYGLANPELEGVWGGLSDNTRARMRKENAA